MRKRVWHNIPLTLPLQPIIGGTYFDKFTKIDGTWRLTERVEDMELIGNLSEHLLIDNFGQG